MSTETPLEREVRERDQAQAALRVLGERGYAPARLAELYDRGVHPDLIMMRLWAYPCGAEVTLHWDQWMVAVVVCSHGRFRGASNGPYNPIGQSLSYAFKAFLRAEHDVCTEQLHEYANEDNYTDHCVVCQKELLLW